MIERFWDWIKNTKTRTVIIFFSFAFMTLFTIAVLIISSNGNTVPDSLIYCVFFALTVAIVMSGILTLKGIKIKRVKVGDNELELESEESEED